MFHPDYTEVWTQQLQSTLLSKTKTFSFFLFCNLKFALISSKKKCNLLAFLFYLVLVVMINSLICSECLMTHSAVHLQNYPSWTHQLKNNKKVWKKKGGNKRDRKRSRKRRFCVCLCAQRSKKDKSGSVERSGEENDDPFQEHDSAGGPK